MKLHDVGSTADGAGSHLGRTDTGAERRSHPARHQLATVDHGAATATRIDDDGRRSPAPRLATSHVGRGCLVDTYLADPAGKIALIDRGTCNVSEKVRRASDAGATAIIIGLIALGDAVSFSNGGQLRTAERHLQADDRDPAGNFECHQGRGRRQRDDLGH